MELGEPTTPPLQAAEFRKAVLQRYDGETVEECIGAAVDDVWPVATSNEGQPMAKDEHPSPSTAAPEYRAHQREAIVDILSKLYVEDKDVVTLSAPTGAGKSLILYAAMAVVDEFARKSFFTTPLNALIDQVDGDDFIADDVITLKGKNNYSCVHPQDRGAPVDKAVCQRVDDFDCEYKDQHHERGGCGYYGRKMVAQTEAEMVTNLSYLMANSMIPDEVDSKFDPRELLVIDECQSIEDFALQFIGVTVSQQTVPVVWDLIPQPPRTEDTERLTQWLTKEVLPPVEGELAELDARGELTEQQVDDQEKLQEFSRKVNNLVSDVRDSHWVANREVEDDDWSVEFEPIFIGRFLDRFLWSQGHKVVLSSATIPKGGFLEEVGLGDSEVGRVEVPSTFPRGRRPVYTDEAVGKMTMGQRDRTIPKMARRIGAIADHHWEQEQFRGFVHCHSYSIAARLYESLPRDVRMRTRVQDGDDREASLDAWLDAPVDERGRAEDEGGQVFLSVAMDEGISLDDWRARWQVVAKAAYPYLGPEAKRANYRMDELNDWNWYASKAVVNLQQAVGRGTRSKTDFCLTYILDKSAVQLIEKNEWQFEDWWLDALDVAPADDVPDRY